MSPSRSVVIGPNSKDGFKTKFLRQKFVSLNKKCLKKGLSLSDLRELTDEVGGSSVAPNKPRGRTVLWYVGAAAVAIVVFLSPRLQFLDGVMKSALAIKCLVPNNFVVWEATRPPTDCNICKSVNGVLSLPNVTREEFAEYAYSHRPIVVKGAAAHWPAVRTLTFDFFKDLFESTEGAYESVEEECQFLNFKSDFGSLRDVFSMPKDRVLNKNGATPWYIGWSNCHPKVLKEMRKHYDKPHFLPADAEHAHVDYVFMGYQQGAFMHLDYIARLMWQAQLQGHKVWRLNPPPECETVCQGFSFTVSPGDILLLDTRQWYHDTHIHNGEFSLTVSSEYG